MEDHWWLVIWHLVWWCEQPAIAMLRLSTLDNFFVHSHFCVQPFLFGFMAPIMGDATLTVFHFPPAAQLAFSDDAVVT